MKKNNKDEKKNQSLTPEEMMEIAVLQEELNVLKKEHGIEDEKKGFAKFIDLYFNSGTAKTEEKPKKERVLSVVNRKKYGWIVVLTGWFGGHHFYAKRYKLGLLYLLFFWSGFPAAMAIVDWLIWLPKKPDENGNIEI